jgi:hypothetical protein
MCDSRGGCRDEARHAETKLRPAEQQSRNQIQEAFPFPVTMLFVKNGIGGKERKRP